MSKPIKMDIVRTPEEMQKRALSFKREGRVIGFVPTMGYLHEGYLSLMRTARQQCDVLVVSIFVNPTQFGPNEDLKAYPRDFERDEMLCRQEGVDLIFYPEPGDMYSADSSVWIDEEALAGNLCGAARPGHFRGVCTVVAKLFNLVQPDLAVFGEKDAQQLRIIERMVRDLNFPVKIVRGAIVREADGLAMSSRNRYLSTSQRQQALCLRRALDKIVELSRNGESSVSVLRQSIIDGIRREPDAAIDYVEFVDDSSLIATKQVEQPTLVALAVKFGQIRLIDNDILHV
jgi:pantoate--beta-alanine ligase